MADKLRAQQQQEALQARYIGTGNPDTTRHEWTTNIQRDSIASYIGHPPLLQYMSIGLGQCRERTRIQLMERMIRPCGPPPTQGDNKKAGDAKADDKEDEADKEDETEKK